MVTYRYPIHHQDDTRHLLALTSSGHREVFNQAGTAFEIDNSPDSLPPDGQYPIFQQDGTEVRIPFVTFAGTSMDFTTLTRLKTQLTGISTTADDTFLENLITAVSAHFERYMRRNVLKQTYTEQFRIRRWKQVLSLNAYPIESVSSVKYASHNSLFADADALPATSYIIANDGQPGHIEFMQEMSLPQGFAEVVYVGGLAEDQAELELLYPQLVQACDYQCAYEFDRRKALGGNITFTGGGTSFDSAIDMLPRVKKILDSFRRHYIGG